MMHWIKLVRKVCARWTNDYVCLPLSFPVIEGSWRKQEAVARKQIMLRLKCTRGICFLSGGEGRTPIMEILEAVVASQASGYNEITLRFICPWQCALVKRFSGRKCIAHTEEKISWLWGWSWRDGGRQSSDRSESSRITNNHQQKQKHN